MNSITWTSTEAGRGSGTNQLVPTCRTTNMTTNRTGTRFGSRDRIDSIVMTAATSILSQWYWLETGKRRNDEENSKVQSARSTARQRMLTCPYTLYDVSRPAYRREIP